MRVSPGRERGPVDGGAPRGCLCAVASVRTRCVLETGET